MRRIASLLPWTRRVNAGGPELRAQVQTLCQSAQTVREHRIAQMNIHREEALHRVKTSHGITDEEFSHALKLGRQAIQDYKAEAKPELKTQLPPQMLAYVQNLLDQVCFRKFC